MLEDVAAWLGERGISQWPERFSPEWIAPSIQRGETWLAECDGRTAGTITITTSDPAWPDDEGDARYVHRLAIERWAVGLGAVLLRWASDHARQHGCRYLRLDCLSSNARLCRYYEDAGFEPCGQGEVHGATVRRYQLYLSDE